MPLTKTAPTSRPAMKNSSSAGSFVQTAEESPNVVSFAMRSASSRLPTR